MIIFDKEYIKAGFTVSSDKDETIWRYSPKTKEEAIAILKMSGMSETIWNPGGCESSDKDFNIDMNIEISKSDGEFAAIVTIDGDTYTLDDDEFRDFVMSLGK